jgi:hypothetical protein
MHQLQILTKPEYKATKKALKAKLKAIQKDIHTAEILLGYSRGSRLADIGTDLNGLLVEEASVKQDIVRLKKAWKVGIWQ